MNPAPQPADRVLGIPKLCSALNVPLLYRIFWNLIGGPAYIKAYVDQYVKPQADCRILDIGCGPGNTVPYFPAAEYVGFDPDPNYIETARRRFPQATFVCDRVSAYSLGQRSHFDFALALGVVHHLNDAEAVQLFQTAYQALKPGAKLVTLDGVLVPGQSAAARYLVLRDRGHFVRTEEGYRRLASQVFSQVKANVRHDLLRIPYTHLILECVRDT